MGPHDNYNKVSKMPNNNNNLDFEPAQHQSLPIERFKLDSKYSGLQRNIWREFKELDIQLNPVNLSSGCPDFIPAKYIIDEWNTYCGTDDARMHQYTNHTGHPRLVNALSKLYGKLLQRTIDPKNEVLITLGASNALFCSIMSNIGFGEEVIIIEPSFDCYESLVRLAGGTPVFIPLRQTTSSSSSSWKLDPIELRSMFNKNTKAIILNTPNNPLGKVFSREELQEIGNLCAEFNVIIISDEVYEWFVFEGEHIRMASIPGAWERTITLGSVGKTFGLTGWRLGWAYGPSYLIRNLQVAISNSVYSIDTPAQEVIAVTLERELDRLGTPESIFNQMKLDLKKRRDQMVEIVKGCGLDPVIPEAGIFLLANWKSIESRVDLSDEKDEFRDFRFVKWLVKHFNLLGIPPSLFYSAPHKEIAQHYIRLCFYRKNETLEKAREILKDLRSLE